MSGDGPPPHFASRSPFPLLATLAIQVLAAMAVLAPPVFAPVAVRDIGVPASSIGLFVAASYAASMASSLLAGDLVKKLGAIRISQISLLLCALGLALATAASVPALLVSALLIGLGYGAVTPASSHILAKSTAPRMMSLVFSLKQTGVPIGGALAGALVPTLVLWHGWRAAALLVCLGCIVVAVAVQPVRRLFDSEREPARRVRMANIGGPLRLAATVPAARRLSACSLAFAALQLCLATYLVTYLAHDLGYTLVQAGLMLAVAQGAGIVARIAWGALADRGGRPLLVLGGIGCAMALSAVALSLLAADTPRLLVMFVCAAFGATAIGWNGVFLAEVARNAPPGQASDATGGALFFTYLGILIGPSIFALIAGGGLGYPAAYVLIAIPALACGLWLALQAPPSIVAAIPKAPSSGTGSMTNASDAHSVPSASTPLSQEYFDDC